MSEPVINVADDKTSTVTKQDGGGLHASEPAKNIMAGKTTILPKENNSALDLSDPVGDELRGKAAPAPKKGNRGLSKGIYALGNSVKDGAIWGSIVTLLLIVGIGLGKGKAAVSKDANIFSKTAEVIENAHKGIKKWFGELFEKMVGKQKNKIPFSITGAEVGTAVLAGTVAGHLVQIPSFHSGWKDAAAEEKHNVALEKQRQDLTTLNKALVHENTKYRTQFAKRDTDIPFTERVQKPSEAELAAAPVNNR